MDALPNAKRPLMTDAGLSAAVEAVAIDEYGAIRNGHVAAERALTLYLDKQELVTLMTLGTRPEMLVLGWLRNQRLIRDIEQIKAIQVDWETDSVAITTYEGVQGVEEKMARKTVTTGCGQGTVFGDLMDDLEKIELPRRRIRQSEIYRLLHTLNEYNQVYQRAGAVHGCALCSEEQIHLFIEDVGRHNAVDAIAGHMWLEETDGSDKIFYTTGRLTSEMVIKVAQMGIPVLLSRSGITQMGLELARKVGVTLIARAKGRHFLVYNGADQISFDAVPEIRPQKSGARQAGQSKSR
ncbi:MAG: formate dehydrogenase accessory sulfurtransferase FdhD [Candidatus Thiodiazotropha endolucinida]|nr:formate dehydrogenase accessory sulfurtransferase FdhD [Candidatus Thiodiazotropha taylori]MCG8096229.1 formate dehydrogenase accessory sulfurtransferase FdhD [Candidatus Thiodiazotropha endolucinida]MCG8061831.1 formate dehydrogenase accessory sulfurtransferase FdhD [Candidatus Thiodiazotropha taylori]MCG8066141.1 formate dehydrogenase accessory sulfurtransferase FdhD [Candidatus Thiodiazotropha taylori]MCW4332238.1 formate dehydrogenase accessory sulfurtransferase FdhD [Candidatus Thiodiaz